MWNVVCKYVGGDTHTIAGCDDRYVAEFIAEAFNENALIMTRDVSYSVLSTKEDSE